MASGRTTLDVVVESCAAALLTAAAASVAESGREADLPAMLGRASEAIAVVSARMAEIGGSDD